MAVSVDRTLTKLPYGNVWERGGPHGLVGAYAGIAGAGGGGLAVMRINLPVKQAEGMMIMWRRITLVTNTTNAVTVELHIATDYFGIGDRIAAGVTIVGSNGTALEFQVPQFWHPPSFPGDATIIEARTANVDLATTTLIVMGEYYLRSRVRQSTGLVIRW